MRAKSDGELMQMIANGNESAFQEVYHRYSRLVFGYGVRILKERGLAEDVAQEVWIRVVRLSTSYRGEGALKFWLMKVTRNSALTLIRKRGVVAETVVGEEPTADAAETAEQLTRGIELARLSERMSQLPDGQRVALVLWISESLSYDEIASEMNVSVEAVKSLIFRARKTLLKETDHE